MSNCCIKDLRNKEVINVKNGCKLGYVGDVEINIKTGCLVAIIVWRVGRCFGLVGRNEDLRICWEEIQVIGDQTILVCVDDTCCDSCGINQGASNGCKNIFDNLFRF